MNVRLPITWDAYLTRRSQHTVLSDMMLNLDRHGYHVPKALKQDVKALRDAIFEVSLKCRTCEKYFTVDFRVTDRAISAQGVCGKCMNDISSGDEEDPFDPFAEDEDPPEAYSNG